MENDGTDLPSKCYQCGSTEFALTDEGAETGWITCDRCGERVVSADELRAAIRKQEETAIREKLGVDEFLHARRIKD